MADQEENVEQQEETAEEAAETETTGEAPAEEVAEASSDAPAEQAAEATDDASDEAEATEAAAEDASAEEASSDEAPAEEPAEAAAESEESAEPEAAAETEATAEAEAPAEAEAAPAASDAPTEELTWEVLHKKTVAELRDIAQGIEHDALQGYSTMHKEQLVPALCAALGIEAHAHHEVIGINKDRVKTKIKALKVERQAAVEAGDRAQLKLVRKRIKSLKRKIRRATV